MGGDQAPRVGWPEEEGEASEGCVQVGGGSSQGGSDRAQEGSSCLQGRGGNTQRWFGSPRFVDPARGLPSECASPTSTDPQVTCKAGLVPVTGCPSTAVQVSWMESGWG